MTSFSVIIPTYGRPRYLREAVASVLAQTDQDFEIIVVDDCSPERVPEFADCRIKLVRRPSNGGPAAARNSGINAATGRWLTFLDDDDVYDTERLRVARRGLGSAPVALCWFRYFGHKPGGRALNGTVGGDLLAGTVPHLGATAVERSICAHFDESYRGPEDIEWWIRMAGHQVSTVEEVGYWMRRHDGARTGYGIDSRIEGSLRMIEEHPAFFRANPSAAAFRWRRIGIMSDQAGNRSGALKAYATSMGLDPSLRTMVNAMRLLKPRTSLGSRDD